jgi:hypothetical protein
VEGAGAGDGDEEDGATAAGELAAASTGDGAGATDVLSVVGDGETAAKTVGAVVDVMEDVVVFAVDDE